MGSRLDGVFVFAMDWFYVMRETLNIKSGEGMKYCVGFSGHVESCSIRSCVRFRVPWPFQTHARERERGMVLIRARETWVEIGDALAKEERGLA